MKHKIVCPNCNGTGQLEGKNWEISVNVNLKDERTGIESNHNGILLLRNKGGLKEILDSAYKYFTNETDMFDTK